jgi:hypothetical protein
MKDFTQIDSENGHKRGRTDNQEQKHLFARFASEFYYFLRQL